MRERRGEFAKSWGSMQATSWSVLWRIQPARQRRKVPRGGYPVGGPDRAGRTVHCGGGGNEVDELKRQAESLGISKHLIFAGVRLDMADFYAAMDVSALTSLSEGLSITILESMSHGLPVVATAVGGNPGGRCRWSNGIPGAGRGSLDLSPRAAWSRYSKIPPFGSGWGSRTAANRATLSDGQGGGGVLKLYQRVPPVDKSCHGYAEVYPFPP